MAHRYGSVIESGEDAGISYTEKEFRYARAKGIPILAFLIDEKVPVSPEHIEKDPAKQVKLAAFKADVTNDRLVEWWSNPDDLARKVTAALHKQMARKKRPGWVRADGFNIEESHAELLVLNKRVRELEEENSRLRASVVERVPKLSVFLNVDDVDSEESDIFNRSHLVKPDGKGGLAVRLQEVNTNLVEARYLPLEVMDIPSYLLGSVSEKDIAAYNASLPAQAVVDEYLASYAEYMRIKECGIPIVCHISNDGTCKATDISVTIEFPKELLVMEASDVEDLEEPQAPKLPHNPIDEAIKRFHYGAIGMGDFTKREDFNMLRSMVMPSSMYFRTGENTESIYVSENEVIISCDSIVHTKSSWFKGWYLVPRKVGRYQVKCTFMCSEYLEPDVRYLEIMVGD